MKFHEKVEKRAIFLFLPISPDPVDAETYNVKILKLLVKKV